MLHLMQCCTYCNVARDAMLDVIYNVACKSSTKLNIKIREGLKKRTKFGTSVKLVSPHVAEVFFTKPVFSDFYSQRSVTEAWTNHIPWTILSENMIFANLNISHLNKMI